MPPSACSIVSTRSQTAPMRSASARAIVLLPVPGSPASEISNSAPDLAGDLDAAAELGPLFVLGEQIALFGAGEAALRRETKLVEWGELRRLVEAALELVLALERACFGRHHAQHGMLVLGQQAQRLEATRALAV